MRGIIELPIQNDDVIRDLRAGDMFFLSGALVTGRDEVHRRFMREPLPVDIRGGAIFHAGPLVIENRGVKELISIGPTSSIRMEEWAAEFIRKTGVKILIGKGGMGAATTAACGAYTAIHCVYPGGCAVLGAGQAEAIENVWWQDLGMPEALWVIRFRELGPLIVSIDTRGNNLFAENAACYTARAQDCIKPIQEFLRRASPE
jgi:L(+)-tartrate dehydratase beta subunit